MYKISERYIYKLYLPYVMKRKIIKLGQATFVASLPSKWIRRNHLEKGDYLEFEEKESSLIVSTKKRNPSLEITLDVKKLNTRLLRTIVQSYYLLGYDKITLLHKPKIQAYKIEGELNTSKVIQKLVNNRFIGIEIVEQTPNKTSLMDLGGINEDVRLQIFQRLIFMLKTMSKDSYQALKENDSAMLENIKNERYNNINRFLMHYQRITAKTCQEDAIRYAYTMQLLSQFKAIAGVFMHLAEISPEIKKPSGRIMEIFKVLNKSLDTALTICLAYSDEKALDFIQEREGVWKLIKEKKPSLDKNDLTIFAEIKSLLFPTYMVLKSTQPYNILRDI